MMTDSLALKLMLERAKNMSQKAVITNGESSFCSYRSPSGPCLIGALLPDDDPDLNSSLNVSSALCEGKFPSLKWCNKVLLYKAQRLHDSQCLDTFDNQIIIDGLYALAQDYDVIIE